jgi:hypothetical protein
VACSIEPMTTDPPLPIFDSGVMMAALAHRFSFPRAPVSSLAYARDLSHPGAETEALYRLCSIPTGQISLNPDKMKPDLYKIVLLKLF